MREGSVYEPCSNTNYDIMRFVELAHLWKPALCVLITCSQNRHSTKFQNHENINFVEKLYFFILYNQVYIAKHDVESLRSGFIFRENTSHYKVGG